MRAKSALDRITTIGRLCTPCYDFTAYILIVSDFLLEVKLAGFVLIGFIN